MSEQQAAGVDRPFTNQDDQAILAMKTSGAQPQQIADILKRSVKSITQRHRELTATANTTTKPLACSRPFTHLDDGCMNAMAASGAGPQEVADFLKRDLGEILQRAKELTKMTTTTSIKTKRATPPTPPKARTRKEPTRPSNTTSQQPPPTPPATVLQPYTPWTWTPSCGACQDENCTSWSAHERWLEMQDILLAHTRLYTPAAMPMPGPDLSSSDACMLALFDAEYQARRWTALSERFHGWSGRSIPPDVLQRRMEY
ncbi:hypothetical protein B0T25DRAFT_534310 [Lasiosphaeria hispida]|uniref:Uncharacterized protein n=1 Tax=Lasiosphaeria hispida TaxID=260671 RepID=A0AAJ0MI49_9PEZI|nr:hypothetical protein B0T25DRAFT_534310 [Lasiosphaeria hispida]